MENKQKPACEYGEKCYRKNPRHFENYSHPKELHNQKNPMLGSNSPKSKKRKLEEAAKAKKREKEKNSKVKTKQPTLQFRKKDECSNQVVPNSEKLEVSLSKDENQKNLNESNDRQTQELDSDKSGDKGIISESDDEDSDGVKDVQSTSWVFIKRDSNTTTTKFTTNDLEGKSVEEIIKTLFLVEMPQDFYSFFDFCKSFDNNDPSNALKFCGLKLVGPYDILQGKRNYPDDKKLALCHWRFYYDPPECQTILSSDSGFHVGYWRDDPKELPSFVASNNSNKDCIFKIEAENIFGFVYHYLLGFLKTCDPFTKVTVNKFQKSLKDWAEKNKFILEKETAGMKARNKKAVSPTFHNAFISVPVEPSTEVGYRPLLETDESLKDMCKAIMKANDPKERETLWEELEPLIRAANIANDECDFGNSLELGIDLFCMGSPVFHDAVEHLLTTAYDLLKRSEFAEIIRVHLRNRRKGNDMSTF